ncbi:hypothetical protein [Actinoplanes xinjiangensis]|uniref:Uncharacterized protein n=1 Tax=Actinoplanes xinjiangensis TaxID=512350 RepID=A0A316F703_9ACTN|nr:hypothetical protein [Actinoplanes xinjiangensis]PWK42628.1 hypothetical protein BC793_11472 [Actinoplanes xinjiangensis]GIF38188.1 hypothetical protein Axi01nite_24990 [Actinoplanes xinjiangensis]
MTATGEPDVTVLDRRLRLALLDRTGSDVRFVGLVDQALTSALQTGTAGLPHVLYLSLLRAGLSSPAPNGSEPGGQNPSDTGPSSRHRSETGPSVQVPSYTGPSVQGPSYTGPSGRHPDDTGPSGWHPSNTGPNGVGPRQAGLIGGGRGWRLLPFAPEGVPAPGDELEACLREIRAQWSAHTARHLYPTPAEWLQALLPPAPLAGNPYSLARLMRVFAVHLAPTDCGTAASLADLIEDPGEAAIAQGALVGAGLAAHDLDREERAWSRQRHLLTRMPSWSWPGGRDVHDRDVLAYLRPDHRARFDTAVGVLPFSTGLGHALLTGLPALSEVHRGAYACHRSAVYTEQRLCGRRPDPEAAAVHDEVRRDPMAAGPIVAAVVSANEQVLGAAELPVGDPVYRLYARITARTTRAHRLGADDLAPEPVPAVFDLRRLPAYAEIVRRNADTPIVAALAARVRAEAIARDDREALLILADAGYADPDPLLDEPTRPRRHREPFGGPGHAEPKRRPGHVEPKPSPGNEPEMSILLFRHRPDEAVRRVAAAVSADWTVAAAMLEHAAAELLALAGPRIAHDLHDAVVRAVACAAPPCAAPPTVVDGTHPPSGASA